MNMKLIAGLLALALLVGLLIFIVPDGRDATARSPVDVVTPTQVDAPTDLAPTMAQDNAVEPARRVEAQPTARAMTAAAWKGELAGLLGRVIETDGTPVAGIRVALLEGDPTLLFSGSMIGAEEPSLEVEETVTDLDGRFLEEFIEADLNVGGSMQDFGRELVRELTKIGYGSSQIEQRGGEKRNNPGRWK